MFVTVLAIILIFVIIGWQIWEQYKYVTAISSIFQGGKDVYLKDIILFSNHEIAKYIKKSFDKENKCIKLFYLKRKHVLLYSSYSKEQILDKINEIQAMIIDDRIKQCFDLAIDDAIDKYILDIWLDYGYSRRYRTIFRQELPMLLKYNEVTEWQVAEMKARMYKFKRFNHM